MTQEIKEMLPRIYGAYMGSEVVVDDMPYLPHTTYPYHLTGVCGRYVRAENQPLHDALESACEDCKLSLYSIEDISDEDALKLGKMYGRDCEANPFGGDTQLSDKEVIEDVRCRATGLDFSHSEVDILRSWDYDLGYGSITSLISEGIAVRKERK